MRLVIRSVLTGLYVFVVYWVIFGGLVFKVDMPMPTNIMYDASTLKEATDEVGYAYLLEDRKDSLDMRLAVIQAAEEAIDISYYAVHDGLSRDIFYGALLEAANRGVKIRLILDGFVEGRYISDFQITALLIHHENITVKYFENPKIWLPYAVHNRLHDKLIISDHVYGITGGRNIGDRYYKDLDQLENMTYDRDILVFGDETHSAVIDMKNYFNELFEHSYASIPSVSHQDDVGKGQQILIDSYTNYTANLDFDEMMIDLYSDAIPVGKISFLRSPLNRMQKHPVIFDTLTTLAADYDDLWIQSPYFILSNPMQQLFSSIDADITILTNSLYTNPNLAAVSGYQRYRQLLAETTTLWEYQSPMSLHAKTMLMGDDITVIGSLNIDPRSYNLSTESVLVIHSVAFNAHVRETMMGYMNQSLEVDHELGMIPREGVQPVNESLTRRLTRYLVGAFTYFFDELL